MSWARHRSIDLLRTLSIHKSRPSGFQLSSHHQDSKGGLFSWGFAHPFLGAATCGHLSFRSGVGLRFGRRALFLFSAASFHQQGKSFLDGAVEGLAHAISCVRRAGAAPGRIISFTAWRWHRPRTLAGSTLQFVRHFCANGSDPMHALLFILRFGRFTGDGRSICREVMLRALRHTRGDFVFLASADFDTSNSALVSELNLNLLALVSGPNLT